MHRLPEHLKRYISAQDYSRYSPEDQSVWRYIMRQLTDFHSRHAHPVYIDGLKKTGISVEEIPRIETMDKSLAQFGWSAVAISGFIPPAAYLEFQSLGFLPIATEMRSIDHIHYTPAPDIVHESAGHAPILIASEFADYLKNYAQITTHAIFSLEDLEQYEAIRELSDLKENPESTPEQIKRAEQVLQKVNSSIRYVSEAAMMARLYWWTAEYGLVGRDDDPRIYGAGLLSSVGEAKQCLDPKIKKIELTPDCANFGYDITEMQPQIFVSPDFETLHETLEEVSKTMSYRVGGVYGLERALEARTVTTIELNSGLQISGVLMSFEMEADRKTLAFLRFSGPSQMSFKRQELHGHGNADHPGGLLLPLGHIKGRVQCPSTFSKADFASLGLFENKQVRLEFESGVIIQGILDEIVYELDRPLLMIFSEARAEKGQQVIHKPEFGRLSLPLGTSIPSVFGGPADTRKFGERADFLAKILPAKKYSGKQQAVHWMYSRIRKLRESIDELRHKTTHLEVLSQDFYRDFPDQWLVGVELLELSYQLGQEQAYEKLKQHLETVAKTESKIAPYIRDGLRLAQRH